MFFVAAVGVNVAQMRSASPAGGHRRAVVGAECLPHPAANPAPVTLHFHVQSFAAGPDFIEVKQAFAVGVSSLMNEIHPREVVKMPMLARHHEASREYQRGSPLCGAVMNVA